MVLDVTTNILVRKWKFAEMPAWDTWVQLYDHTLGTFVPSTPGTCAVPLMCKHPACAHVGIPTEIKFCKSKTTNLSSELTDQACHCSCASDQLFCSDFSDPMGTRGPRYPGTRG